MDYHKEVRNMYTFLTYILSDGTEVDTYSKALASGQRFKKRFKSYKYEDNKNPFKVPNKQPDYIKEDLVI